MPFFNDDTNYQKGWSWYTKTFFSAAKNGQKTGTITPQYMTGSGKNTPEKIAERIHNQLPNAKIIALLRHPIERSFSQHKMHKRYGFVDESFDESIDRLVSGNELEKHRKKLEPSSQFLLTSEYGRILSRYYELFANNQILILYTDDLRTDPKKVLTELFSFLNVDTNYTPDNINRKSHVGSSKAKIKFLAPGVLKKHPFLNYLWIHIVPIKIRKQIFMRVTRWNIKKDNVKLDKTGQSYNTLLNFFADDVKRLESVTGSKTPWTEWNIDSNKATSSSVDSSAQ